MQCENCGSRNFREENGKITCVACGSNYSSKNTGHLTLEEELREKEIRRLVETKAKDPNTGLLTDEEILKYAPTSIAAEDIRYKNATTLKEKLKIRRNTIFVIIFFLLMFVVMPVTVFIFLR